jgi:hypothetical protein
VSDQAGFFAFRTGILSAIGLALLAAPTFAAEPVEFNRDIRPIFSDKCYTCHGPDKANRKSPLRFDIEEAAKADLGGHFAIVPGNVEKSEIINRITTDDAIRRMPPASSATGSRKGLSGSRTGPSFPQNGLQFHKSRMPAGPAIPSTTLSRRSSSRRS